MKKRKNFFTFILIAAILIQSGFGAWASELEGEGLPETGEQAVWDDETSGEEDSEEKDAAGEVKEEENSEEEGGVKEDVSEEDVPKDGEESEEMDDGQEQEDSPEDDFSEDEDLEMQEYINEAKQALEEIAGKNTLMAIVYLCDTYAVKSRPDSNSETTINAASGTTVIINGVELDEEYNIWYKVTAESGGSFYSGYVERSYLAYSNEIFLAWEDNYFPQRAMFAMESVNDREIEMFPASYRDRLRALKRAHPNWIFVPQNTGLSWDKVVSEECYKDRSLISASMGQEYRVKEHSPNWDYASEAAIKYYLDPRNFLDETRIFQFEQLTYNPSYHSQNAVQNILNGTFMSGTLPGSGMKYSAAFYEIGVSLKVSPFHLACRVYQEQGQGKSPLISGQYKGYEGYYNYFNIGASGSTTEKVIESGLKKAKEKQWNTPYASISGGAQIISKDYILRGQDTLYLQKFDVDNSDNSLFVHQYMQNIRAPFSESQKVKEAYTKSGALENTFVFKIPVYSGMPSAACPVPTPQPTAKPTAKPTAAPTAKPTAKPTAAPTAKPTAKPTAAPTAKPTAKPTAAPTAKPTAKPTAVPTAKPTVKPTAAPTAVPTAKPTAGPTEIPDVKPTAVPETVPTGKPAADPTLVPAGQPATNPAETARPTREPSGENSGQVPVDKPTAKPTAEPAANPTAAPTAKPTAEPTPVPTAAPTAKPTAVPTAKPTAAPTAKPTAVPTAKPTAAPTAKPTAAPTVKPAGKSESTMTQNNQETASTENSQNTGEPAKPTVTPASTAIPDDSGVRTPVSGRGIISSSGVTVSAPTPKPQTAPEKKNVLTIDMTTTNMIYSQTLKQIKDQGMEVVLNMSDAVSWTINGNTIESDEPEDVNMQVLVGSSRIPGKRLELFVSGQNYVEMSLAHDGEFGFTAVLSVKLENAQPSEYANLFYYNKEADEFEFMCASQISSTGRATFEFKHASDYVIILSTEILEGLADEKAQIIEEVKAQEAEAMAQAKEELPAKEPGKAAGIIALILLGSAAIGIGAYLIFRKNDKENE